MTTLTDQLKQQAAEHAVTFVQSGMVVGLGHGTTAMHAIRRIADLLKNGELSGVEGIPCSVHVEVEAKKLGIPITSLEDHPIIDVTIDGADEVDPLLDLIKGGGGALLREKIVAQASRRVIIVVDESKLSPALGTRSPLPVEVVSFGWGVQAAYLESLGGRVTPRQTAEGDVYTTDQGHVILDCRFGPIVDPSSLAEKLDRRTGIVEHGLFIGLVTDVIVAGTGGVRHLVRTSGRSSDGRQ